MVFLIKTFLTKIFLIKMLYLIGIGLNSKQITLEAINAIKNSSQIFLETYTSEYSEGTIKEIEKLTNKKIKLINREEVEIEFEKILPKAKNSNLALLIFGNALTATTHSQFLIDAKNKNIKTKIIPGISITNTIAESGLDEYKFGRTVTICFHLPNFEPESFYDQIKENQKIGLHTICLLDIKKDQKPQMLMNSKEAIEILDKISLKRNEKNNFEYVALIGMGSEKQKIIYGKKNILKFEKINKIFPQTILIPGKVNEKEKEFLELYK
jgi:diphthine synthase